MKKRVGIIGCGNVGTALALALKEKGYPLAGVCCRTEESAQRASAVTGVRYYTSPEEVSLRADIIFITTPDRNIEEVCAYTASRKGFNEGQVVLHTSGAHSSAILNAAQLSGALVLSFHPLQTFPNVQTGLRNLAGSYFAIEGDEDALPLGRELISDLGGIPLIIPTETKSLYHASACTVCNYFVALIDLGLKMMEAAGVLREEALPALLPLIEGTLLNIKKVGVPKALTGPIDRGDILTIESHIRIMNSLLPSATALYGQMGAYTARVAREKGTLSEETENEICSALRDERQAVQTAKVPE